MESPVSVPPQLPHHSPALHNGMSLEPLPAVNEEQVEVFDCGLWSEMVPDQLRPIIRFPERYREAIGVINTVSQTKLRSLPLQVCGYVFGIIFGLVGIPVALIMPIYNGAIRALQIGGIIFIIAVMILILYKMLYLRKHLSERIVRELQKAIGQANSLLFEEKVLMGSQSNSKLLLVYVSVDGCRQELSAQSQDDQLFRKAVRDYSCAYTCCLAKRHFPFQPISNTGHLEGALCFCQYVLHHRSMEKSRRFYWCRRRHPYATFP